MFICWSLWYDAAVLKVYEPTPFYTSIFDRKSFHFPHLVIDEIIEK